MTWFFLLYVLCTLVNGKSIVADCLQANQRVYEWRAAFASAAVSIVNAFFQTCEKLDTDEARTAFADAQIKTFGFLYQTAEGTDRSVR